MARRNQYRASRWRRIGGCGRRAARKLKYKKAAGMGMRSLKPNPKTAPMRRTTMIYVHVCKMEKLREAYALAKKNDGAPGTDGVTFEAIEAQDVEAFLEQIRGELIFPKTLLDHFMRAETNIGDIFARSAGSSTMTEASPL